MIARAHGNVNGGVSVGVWRDAGKGALLIVRKWDGRIIRVEHPVRGRGTVASTSKTRLNPLNTSLINQNRRDPVPVERQREKNHSK